MNIESILYYSRRQHVYEKNPIASMTHLSRVVAYVPKRVDGDQTVHSAVSRKLLSLGAKLVSRFTKDLTHIVFLKKLLATQQEQGREEEILRDLFERAAKVVVIMSKLQSKLTCS